jgi:Flp pilus assembly protein TadD
MRQPLLALLLGAVLLLGCEEESPSDPSPFLEIDQALRAGRYEEALADLEALRPKLGADPELIARLAGIAERQGDLARAVVLHKEGVRAHPEAAGLWSGLGDLYWRLHQHEKAIEAFETARENGQDDAFVALSLGICYGQTGDGERSERELERARSLGAEPTTVDYNLALLRVSAKRYREAVDLFRGAVAADPQNWSALRELGNALLLADPGTPATVEEALRIAWQVVDRQPTDWRAHMLLGDGFMAKQDWVAAVEAYTEALRHGHNPPEVERKYVEAATAMKAAESAAAEQR